MPVRIGRRHVSVLLTSHSFLIDPTMLIKDSATNRKQTCTETKRHLLGLLVELVRKTCENLLLRLSLIHTVIDILETEREDSLVKLEIILLLDLHAYVELRKVDHEALSVTPRRGLQCLPERLVGEAGSRASLPL